MENNVLIEAKNGFERHKSTDTTIQTSIESIQEDLDRGLHTIRPFFDTLKAYDVIRHIIYLQKQSSYGIRGEPNLWFRSYTSK